LADGEGAVDTEALLVVLPLTPGLLGAPDAVPVVEFPFVLNEADLPAEVDDFDALEPKEERLLLLLLLEREVAASPITEQQKTTAITDMITEFSTPFLMIAPFLI
jgi:hypothetical protein